MIRFRLRSCIAIVAVCFALLSCAPTVSWAAPRQAQAAATQLATPAAQLEALSGEYTNPVEPDTPLSFYFQNGKSMYENERRVPVELKPVSSL